MMESARAQPDSRDSVIIESKTLTPGVGKPATVVRVYITNKDSLKALVLALAEKTATGNAYMKLAWPREDTGVVRRLTPTLKGTTFFAGQKYNSVSPDTFTIASFYQPGDLATVEPPNTSRKAFFEIKFDTVKTDTGRIVVDSARVIGGASKAFTSFVTMQRLELPVNFVKGTFTVPPQGGGDPCGMAYWDVQGDGVLTASDLVAMLNCVYGSVRDCERFYRTADIMWLLNIIFPPETPALLLPPPPC